MPNNILSFNAVVIEGVKYTFGGRMGDLMRNAWHRIPNGGRAMRVAKIGGRIVARCPDCDRGAIRKAVRRSEHGREWTDVVTSHMCPKCQGTGVIDPFDDPPPPSTHNED